jgi:hypothetical protein
MQSYLPVIDPEAGEQFATPKDIAALQSCWDAKYSGRTRRHMKKPGFLAFDGMFVVKGFMFSKREGKFVGRVKGTTDEEVLSGMAIPEGDLANEAIQLFWISHCGKVQVPMGFHFVRTVDPDDLAKRLFEAYVRIEKAGFITLGGVTDGATVMKSTQDALKKLVEETTERRTGTEYDALIDYDHWLKSVRGAVWHNDLYNGRGVADGDGHFFSFETLKNLQGSKKAAVRALFAHLTTADLEPSVDEMDTQLALNVVDAKTIAGLEEVVRMLTAKMDIGAEAKLVEVESLQVRVPHAARQRRLGVPQEQAVRRDRGGTQGVPRVHAGQRCHRCGSEEEWRERSSRDQVGVGLCGKAEQRPEVRERRPPGFRPG